MFQDNKKLCAEDGRLFICTYINNPNVNAAIMQGRTAAATRYHCWYTYRATADISRAITGMSSLISRDLTQAARTKPGLTPRNSRLKCMGFAGYCQQIAGTADSQTANGSPPGWWINCHWRCYRTYPALLSLHILTIPRMLDACASESVED